MAFMLLHYMQRLYWNNNDLQSIIIAYKMNTPKDNGGLTHTL